MEGRGFYFISFQLVWSSNAIGGCTALGPCKRRLCVNIQYWYVICYIRECFTSFLNWGTDVTLSRFPVCAIVHGQALNTTAFWHLDLYLMKSWSQSSSSDQNTTPFEPFWMFKSRPLSLGGDKTHNSFSPLALVHPVSQLLSNRISKYGWLFNCETLITKRKWNVGNPCRNMSANGILIQQRCADLPPTTSDAGKCI